MNKLFIQSLSNQLKNIVNSQQYNMPVSVNEIVNLRDNLKSIVNDIDPTKTEISKLLDASISNLFVQNNYNMYFINPVEIGTITAYLDYTVATFDATNIGFWRFIHPRIVNTSKKLFEDQHYANAVNDAFVEIADCVRNLFVRLRPSDSVPTSDVTLMNTVFSENKPIIEICDRSNQSGKDTQKGFMMMISGAFSAIRNPKAHSNFQISEEDAVRKLMLASMFMYKIDDGVSYSNIKE